MSLWFHLSGFHFGYAFLTHSHIQPAEEAMVESSMYSSFDASGPSRNTHRYHSSPSWGQSRNWPRSLDLFRKRRSGQIKERCIRQSHFQHIEAFDSLLEVLEIGKAHPLHGAGTIRPLGAGRLMRIRPTAADWVRPSKTRGAQR